MNSAWIEEFSILAALARVPRLKWGPEELSSGSTLHQVGHFILLDFDSCLTAFSTVPEGGCAAALFLWAMGVLLLAQRGDVWYPLLLLSSLLSKVVCGWFLFWYTLFPFCLEYLCSVADPGGHCLKERAHFIVNFCCHCLCCLFFLPFTFSP